MKDMIRHVAPLVGVIVGFVAMHACTSTNQAVSNTKTGLAVADAVCSELAKDLQDEPEWLKYTCSAVDQATKVVNTFTMKVPRATVEGLAMKHCVMIDTGKAPGGGGPPPGAVAPKK